MIAPADHLLVVCRTHNRGSRIPGWRCPECPSEAAPAATVQRATSRAGRDAEDALDAQLAGAGYVEWADYVREGSWALARGKGYRADFVFPRARLLVEIKGGVHHAVRKQGKRDVQREALATLLGWRVLPVLPEEVRDGSAIKKVVEVVGEAKAS